MKQNRVTQLISMYTAQASSTRRPQTGPSFWTEKRCASLAITALCALLLLPANTVSLPGSEVHSSLKNKVRDRVGSRRLILYCLQCQTEHHTCKTGIAGSDKRNSR